MKYFFLISTFFFFSFAVTHELKNSSQNNRDISSIRSKIGKCAVYIKELAIKSKSLPKIIATGIKNYFGEVIRTKGLRLFLKDYNDPDYQRKYFFLKEFNLEEHLQNPFFMRWPTSALQYLPKKITKYFFNKEFEVRPFSNLHYYLIGKNLDILTKKKFGQRKELTYLITLPPIIYGSIILAEKVDEAYAQELSEKISQQLLEQSDSWKKIVENHFSYRFIKKKFLKGKLDEKAMLISAFNHSTLINSITQIMNDDFDKLSDEDKILTLSTHPLFSDINEAYIEGVSEDNEAFIYLKSFNTKVSTESFLELLEIESSQIVAQQLVWSSLVEGQQKAMAYYKKIVVDDSFHNNILNLFEKGKLSAEKASSYLQEDIYWKSEFKKWKVLSIKKKFKNNDVYENRPLTLDDIRGEIIQEIESNL